jgi:glycosyltransferase involved in cell wall biosynthesis
LAAPRIAILIPAYNEQNSVGDVVLLASSFGDVYVSDDGSSDETSKVASLNGATVFSQGRNYGYNSALSFGISKLREEDYLGVITMDADGQHSANDISLFVDFLVQGFAVVVGVRPTTARLLEAVFGKLSNWFWDIRDPLCGMKAYSQSFLRSVNPLQTYNSVGTELLVYALGSKMPVAEVGISGRDRIGSPRFAGRVKANILIALAMAGGAGAYLRGFFKRNSGSVHK